MKAKNKNREKTTSMKPNRQLKENLVTMFVCASFAINLIAQNSFEDGFESGALHSFWSTYANAGNVTFPAANQAHGGSQSVALESVANAGQKNIGLFHNFPAPIYGRASLWVYDSTADQLSGNYIGFHLRNTQLGVSASIVTQDYDLGPSNGGNYYFDAFGQAADGRSSVDRTEAWHQFTITATTNDLILEVDGQVVYAGTGGIPFNRVEFEIHGPTWRPAVVANFDDFLLESSSGGTPASLAMQMYAGLTITGQAGATYQIQYSTNLSNPTNWIALTNLTLPTSPYLFVDATSVNRSASFYRAVLLP